MTLTSPSPILEDQPEGDLGYNDIGRPAATVSLRRNDLVIERPQRHSEFGPRFEVVCSGDGSTGALVRTDGEVLVEGLGALDGGFVGADILVDVVIGSIGGHATLVCATGRGIVSTEILVYIIFYKRLGSPAIDRKVTIAHWLVVGSVGNRSETQVKSR